MSFKSARILATTAILASVATTATAADTGEGYINGTNPTIFEVTSNGQAYTKFDQLGMVVISGKLKYNTGTVGRIKSWTANPEIGDGVFKVQGMNLYKISKSYSPGNRPKVLNRSLDFSVPAAAMQGALVGMCNHMATQLRNQGKTNAQIFSKTRTLKLPIAMRYSVEANGAGSNDPIFEYWAPHEVTLRCMKHHKPVQPLDQSVMKMPLSVKDAVLQVSELSTLTGTCKVKTRTEITASEPNATIKYRFVDNNGQRSKIFSTKTNGSNLAVVNRQWDIPNGKGIEMGSIRVEGISPKFQSNWSTYWMDCTVNAPGGLAPQPKKPMVGTIKGAPQKPTIGQVKAAPKRPAVTPRVTTKAGIRLRGG